MNRIRFTSFALLTALAAGAAFAGPLDPPAGPITSTYKTLTEVEPRTVINAANTPGDATSVYRITQPGSYYLSGNITGAPSKSAIKIEASNVTIDLNGFTIQGTTGSTFGILNTGAVYNHGSVIKNGKIRGFASAGIHFGMGGVTAMSTTYERLDIGFCGYGIYSGLDAIVRDCTLHDNTSDGIIMNRGLVTNCVVSSNAGDGISGAPALISDCVVTSSGADGISFGGPGTVKGTTIDGTGTTGRGIIGALVNVSGCTIRNVGTGISFSSGTITQCTIDTCHDDGIYTYGWGTRITNNTIRSAGGSSATTGAAIRVGGSDCVIEGNNCSNSDRGINVTTTGNLIMRNACSNNTTNYVIVSGNRYSQIIDLSASTGAAVNGSAAASNLVSTDPNANYSY